MAASLPRRLSAAARSASRSSPKIFSAICGAHAGQHVVEAVRDRLADVDRQPAAPPAARGCRRSIACSSRRTRLEVDFDLGQCTPSACSSSSARPVRRPTTSTSGTSMMRRSAIRPTRLDSASEMPGLNGHVDRERAFVERRQERARQTRSRRRAASADGERARATISAWGSGRRASRSARVAALEHAHQRSCRARRGASAPAAGSRPCTGVSVIETTRLARIETM